MRLKDKVAVITGAASGFGEGMTRRFAEEGARVVVADLNAKGAQRLAAEIGANAIAVTTDVSQPSSIENMVAAARAAFGRIDVMVNNAGFAHRSGDMLGVDEPTFDLLTAVNMKAIYFSTLAVTPLMQKQGGGCIISTASIAGLRPRPGLTWYNASKGWVITATKSMAVELAPMNIRVNCICPAPSNSGMAERIATNNHSSEKEAEITAEIPLGRLSTPMDVANAALWLASDEARFITGVALEVDGGRSV